MKLYTARYTDSLVNTPALYYNRPAGDLFGALPVGTTPKTWGTGEDPWDGALLLNSHGREIQVTAAEYSIPPGPWYVRTDRQFYGRHRQPLCVATFPESDAQDDLYPPDSPERLWLLRLFDSWEGPDIALAYAAAALPELVAACRLVEERIDDRNPDSTAPLSIVLSPEEGRAIVAAAMKADNRGTQPAAESGFATEFQSRDRVHRPNTPVLVFSTSPDDFAQCVARTKRLPATAKTSREDLIDLLGKAFCFVEEAKDDPANKPGLVAKLVREIRAALENA